MRGAEVYQEARMQGRTPEQVLRLILEHVEDPETAVDGREDTMSRILEPIDLLPWAFCVGVGLVLLSLGLAFAVLIVRAAAGVHIS